MQGGTMRSMNDLSEAAEQWSEVYANSGIKLPIMTYDHVKLWYECFAESDHIRVFKAMEGKQIIGYLPMIIKVRKGVRVLTNQANYHCQYGEALVRSGHEEIFKRKILEEILKEKGWDVLHNVFDYSFSGIYPLFPESLLANVKRRWKMNIQPTYTVVLDKSCDEYFQKNLSANMRKSLKLKKNRLKKAGPHSYLHFEGDAAVGKWQEFLRIEDSGWKGRDGTSILKTEPEYRKYYEELTRNLSSTKDLHLYFLELNQKYIAAVFGYTAGDVFQYLKIGYDEEYQALSPSHLLFMFLMEDIQQHHKEIKRIHLFPYDDAGYKIRFANEEQHYAEIILYNNTIRGRMLYALQRMKRQIAKHPKLARHIKRIFSAGKS